MLLEHQLALDGRLVWSVISRETLAEAGAVREDLDGAIDLLKGVKGVHTAALLSQLDDGSFKVSLRSVESIDVERVARELGGGGHAKAAGYSATGTAQEILDTLKDVLNKELDT